MKIALWGSEVALNMALDIKVAETKETSLGLELFIPFGIYFDSAFLHGMICIRQCRDCC